MGFSTRNLRIKMLPTNRDNKLGFKLSPQSSLHYYGHRKIFRMLNSLLTVHLTQEKLLTNFNNSERENKKETDWHGATEGYI